MSKSAIKLIKEFGEYCEANKRTLTSKDLLMLCERCEVLFGQQIAMAYDAGLERGIKESDILVTDEPLPLFGEEYYREKFH